MEPVSSILAATDFSEDAGSAAARAAQLAAEHGAALSLLHVLSAPSVASLRVWLQPAAEVERQLTEQAQRALAELARQLPPAKGAASTVLRVGAVLDEILAASRTADLLVLGAHGMNPLRDLILGTTAERLLRKCVRPVLVVKRAPAGPYRRLMIPVDFSPHSVAAARAAARFAPAADFHLLHAFEVPFEGKLQFAGVSQARIDALRAHARQQAVESMGTLAREIGAPMERLHRTVAHGGPARLIHDQESTIGADLIVIGKHGQSAAEELFLGSVTRHVLSSAACDVMVVPEPVAPPQARPA